MTNKKIPILSTRKDVLNTQLPSTFLWHGDVENFLDSLPEVPLFDLVITSPPYNIGKPYEQKQELHNYLKWQKNIIGKIVSRLKPTGSLCWQVGNFVEKRKGENSSTILPLDIVFYEIFHKLELKLRNRVIWHFGHGLHCKHRFSGRYEIVLWFTKTDNYTFNLDNVRIEPKYPGKKHFKGPKSGEYSCNPKGKNPEDLWTFTNRDLTTWDQSIWDIPNVKSNHVEKTEHPCQFPVALVDRFVLSLTNPGELVFDPFAGVGSAGVASLINGRRFGGCELEEKYIKIAKNRLELAIKGEAKYRPFEKPIYDHTKSNLSKRVNR